MALPQSLPQIFQTHHQIWAVQDETAPVLQNPQTLPGTIEVGIQKPLDGAPLATIHRLSRRGEVCHPTSIRETH